MASFSIDNANLLKNKLNQIISGTTTAEALADRLFGEFDGTNNEHLILSAKTIRNYWQKLSPSEIASLNSTYPARLLEALIILEDNDKKNMSDIRDQAKDFFTTRDTKYEYEDLNKLVGKYDMYRQYWVDPNSNDFMRTQVRIMQRGKHYVFTEYQKWPDEDITDICTGYLFPSGKNIIAICKSRTGQNIKFISISNLRTDPKRFQKLMQFSGSLIVTSDQAPHPGYGFHCIRNTESIKMPEIIKKELMEKNVEIYSNIMINQSKNWN